MTTKGQNRGIRETQALVSIWGELELQQELQKSVHNDQAFTKISAELAAILLYTYIHRETFLPM